MSPADTARPIRAVMFFAEAPDEAARWWAAHMAGGAPVDAETGGFWWCDLGGIEVGFHPADPVRNALGGSPVVYWAVDDLEARRRDLLAAGCTSHRGPLEVTGSRSICQLVDPFGNVFGLDGLTNGS